MWRDSVGDSLTGKLPTNTVRSRRQSLRKSKHNKSAHGAGMSDVVQSSKEPLWRLGFKSLETECKEPVKLETIGRVPEELFGTLYRNGPARHVVYGDPLRHWFDGDGMVHAFELSASGARYRNRFVDTKERAEENRKSRRIWRTFATPPAGGPIRRFLRRHHGKNSANTNVVFHAGTLFALCEGSKPMRLDPISLATIDEDDLDGAIVGTTEGYSAHPRFDESTGEMWNFTSTYGPKPLTRILCRDAAGRTRVVAEIPMVYPAMLHDFALTPTYVILKYDPYMIPRVPFALMFGQKSFGQSLAWYPDKSSKIVLIPRAGGEIRSVDVPPRLSEHVIHAFEDGGDIVLDVLSYDDDKIMTTFIEVMVGPIKTPAVSYPERIRISHSGAVDVERIGDTAMELARHLAPLGSRHRHVWATAWTDLTDMMSTPVRLDVEAKTTVFASMQQGEFAGECVPVRKRGATSADAAWVLTVILDAINKRSELRVLDGENLAAAPVARIIAPHMIPFGFHGNFVPQVELSRYTG